jgi:hypothetical protein
LLNDAFDFSIAALLQCAIRECRNHPIRNRRMNQPIGNRQSAMGAIYLPFTTSVPFMSRQPGSLVRLQ